MPALFPAVREAKARGERLPAPTEVEEAAAPACVGKMIKTKIDTRQCFALYVVSPSGQ